jgi:hypothetical protein
MNYLYKISYAHLQWLIVVFKLEVKLRVQAVTTLYIYKLQQQMLHIL